MEDLPEALVAEILKKITTSDRNSLSLVSKQLYKIEGNQRGALRVGSGLCTATEALTSLCTRFPNLSKMEIDYSGWIPEHGNQLDNKGLFVFSSHCSSLIDLTLSFCSCIDDSGLGCLAYCKTLASLRLNFAPETTSIGLFIAQTPCLSNLTLQMCHELTHVGVAELGRAHKLNYLVIEYCGKVSLEAAQGVAKSVHYSKNCSAALWKKIGLGAAIDEVVSKIVSINFLLKPSGW